MSVRPTAFRPSAQVRYIESSLREIIGSKNFALINLSLNFCETTIYDNKVFLENLVAALTLYEIITDFMKFCYCCVLEE